MHKSSVVELSVVVNYNLLAGFAVLRPKDYRFVIPPLGLGSADENLGGICVWFSIFYGQDTRTCLFLDEILTIQYLSVNGVATRTTLTCEVPTQAWKSWDASGKAKSLISESFFLQH